MTFVDNAMDNLDLFEISEEFLENEVVSMMGGGE